MLKEAFNVMRDRKEPINLQDLHENCSQGKAHKTIREYGSIIRLKGSAVIFKDGEEEIYMVNWKDGPNKMIALSIYEIDLPAIDIAINKQKNRDTSLVIEV
jgi:hypothetical protein